MVATAAEHVDLLVERLDVVEVHILASKGHEGALADTAVHELGAHAQRVHIALVAPGHGGLLLELDNLRPEHKVVAVQEVDGAVLAGQVAKEDGLTHAEVVDGGGQRAGHEHLHRGRVTARDDLQRTTDFFLNIAHDLAELGHVALAREHLAIAAQVDAQAVEVHVLELAELAHGGHELVAHHALAQIAQLVHQDHVMNAVLVGGFAVERTHGLHLGVQAGVGKAHHVLDLAQHGDADEPLLHVELTVADEVVDARLADAVDAGVDEAAHHLEVVGEHLGDHGEAYAVLAADALHGAGVLQNAVDFDFDGGVGAVGDLH